MLAPGTWRRLNMSTTKASAIKAADRAFKASADADHKDENLLEAWAVAEHAYQSVIGTVIERTMMSWCSTLEEAEKLHNRRMSLAS